MLARASRKKRKKGPKAKRAPTGYTLYVQENYESIKRAHEANAAGADGGSVMNSKDILATLARHWTQVDEQEKRAWQEKADQLKLAAQAAATATEASLGETAEAIEEEGLPEPPTADLRADRKPPPESAGASAQV